MNSDITRILSIDGGGIKGVLPAAFLAEIEEMTGKRIVDHFDLIAGTSTGGIIALGLGLGLTARRILDFYLEKGAAIFYQDQGASHVWSKAWAKLRGWMRGGRQLFMPKYEPHRLRAALSDAFQQRILGESQTRLVIPSYHPLQRDVYIFKTAHHERFESDWRRPAVDVALATAAAPTYFPSHRMANGTALIDGGVWANSPLGLAVVEAIGVLERDRESLRVLSLGCTEEVWSVPPRAGGKDLFLAAAGLFLQAQCKGSIGTAEILTGHTETNPKVFRYSPTVARGTFHLDTVGMIEELSSLGVTYARQALPVLNEVFLATTRERFLPHHGQAL